MKNLQIGEYWHNFQRASLVTLLLMLTSASINASPQQRVRDITELALEDLMNVEITSVSRRAQPASQAASAVYVITAEDIRRSGVTTIPDALRLAPGVQVMQMDGNKWAIGIRGFTGRFSSKLLVMIDGRSVYSPIYAGVNWDANDVLLDDVDRIEVIRGPGATMWGSNAVSGVINIITKPARETQGGVATAGGGDQEGGFGSARFGSAVTPRLHYRFYSKYNSRSGQFLPSGERANDNWRKMQGGFRFDWNPSDKDELIVAGDVYEGDGGERFPIPIRQAPFQQLTPYRTSMSGTNVLTRWTHRHSNGSLTQVQAYFDRAVRDNLLERNTSYSLGDAEVQHEQQLSNHRLMVGFGYRVSSDHTPSEWFGRFNPSRRTLQRVNTFIQDEISLVPDKLVLAVGSKFENNTFTSWQVQPSASLLWNVTARDSFWISAARASKTPSRANRDLIYDSFTAPGPQGSLILGQVLGSNDVRSEHLVDFEGGYRFSPAANLSFDLTAFHNSFTDLVSLREGDPTFFLDGTQPTTIIPVIQTNGGERDLYGAELAASWRPLEAARFRFSYSWLRGGTDSQVDVAGPAHQFHARWFWTLPRAVEWDTSYFFVDHYAGIRAYHRVDTRLAWRPASRWELSVVGQHLLDNQHLESPALFVVPTEVGRSIYAKLALLF